MAKTSIIVIVFFVLGYALGNFVPLQKFSTNTQDTANTGEVARISDGKGLLAVTVRDSSNQPVIGIEIDVAVQPGPPESWGAKEADTNGTANFELNPGTYYVFFNANRFPSGYVFPSSEKVNIEEGQIENITIVLEKN